MEHQYDIAVIGSGPGGYVAAIRASQLGLKTAVIEKHEVGGICLNWGCIPSKAIINQAKIYSSIPALEKMGIKTDKANFKYESVYERSRIAADRLSKGVAFLFKKNKVDLIPGTAKIIERNTIRIGDTNELTSKNIIIATGSSPKGIPGFKIDEENILSSTGALKLKILPKSIIILGAGAVGLEFAYMFNSFGVNVIIVEMLETLFPTGDIEISVALERLFRKKKIETYLGFRASSCIRKDETFEISIEKEGKKSVLKAEIILVAVGRKANIKNIGIEELGIITVNGFIDTGDYYKTNIDNVFAIGDVINTPLLAHVASKEGEIAAEFIAGVKTEARIKNDEIPYGVYCEPQIAGFGITEKEAIENKINYSKAVFPYRGAGKAVAMDDTEGMVKILFEKETTEILGAHIIGADATELIHEILLAKKSELVLENIAKMIHAHPTLSEAVMEAARAGEGWAIHI
jgi:dihydrolipoamide dehydrogenase